MKETGPLQVGLSGTADLTVESGHTAAHVGSGTEEVLATPVMIALMEAAAVDCVEHLLEPGQTSLGIRIAVDHSAASPVGVPVRAQAGLSAIDGRRLTFDVRAFEGDHLIGSGTHVRAIVSVADFRRRLAERKS